MNPTEDAIQNLYRFFDVLNEEQRKERDKCIDTIREQNALLAAAVVALDKAQIWDVDLEPHAEAIELAKGLVG